MSPHRFQHPAAVRPHWIGHAPLRRPAGWLLFLVFGALVGAAYYAVSSPVLKVVTFGVLGVAPVVAVVAGVRRYRPSCPTAWYLFAAGQLAFTVGDMIFYVHEYLLRQEPPFPSVADVFYLATYPCLIIGLLLLVKRRTPGRDRASLVDALIVAVSMGLLSWEFLMVPYLRDPDLTLLQRLTSLAYPMMDMLVLAVTARLWSDRGVRNGSFHLLSFSLVPLVVADTLYGLIQLTGTWRLGSPVDIGWMLFYVCWGAAGLHPSMRELDRPAPAATVKVTRTRFGVLLALASLMGPTVLAVQVARGERVDMAVVVGGSLLLFVLALLRMSGLVQALRTTLLKHQRSVTRETILREAAAELVAATSQDGIHTAALAAALALTGRSDATAVRIAIGRRDQLRIVAATEESATEESATEESATEESAGGLVGTTLETANLPAAVLAGLDQASVIVRSATVAELYGELRLGSTFGFLLVVPMPVQRELGGLLLVASQSRQPAEIQEALQTLGAQVALALESEALIEDLHRRRSDERFRRLVQNSSDLITVMEADWTIRYQTPSVERVLGYQPDELLGTNLGELIHLQDTERMAQLLARTSRHDGVNGPIECQMLHADGRWLTVETISNHVDDDELRGYVLTSRDVTDRKALEDQLKHQAFHDSLTGLANRALFANRVQHLLERRHWNGVGCAVFFLDLDDFKTVNDSLGHAAGDELLRAVADRLRNHMRAGDTAARLGGDEFALLLEELVDEREVLAAADRILGALQAPFAVQGKEVVARASIGIALPDLDRPQEADELLRNADMAMYTAKNNGKGRYEWFAPSMHAAVVERLELTADLRRAVERSELFVLYQPIIDMATGRRTGVEALVRWRHPQRGLVGPDEFIALAEETGLILPLGRLVLEQACRHGARWYQQHGRELTINVNLSIRQLQDPGFVNQVTQILAASQLRAHCLTLEITESLLMQDTEAAIEKLTALKRLGVRVAIDDFGTGYSSLSYLQQLPIDILKIPKPFIDGVVKTGDESALARAIIKLAKTLRLETIAEGIEQQEQWDKLRELDCDLGQGYFFSQPVESDDIDALLARESHTNRFEPDPHPQQTAEKPS
jgi:diguanylate cyclase (GGDEF)-like protein/PAS domain S-box-containing protein